MPFPRPYINTIPEEDADPTMIAVPKKTTGIGSRPSGLPKDVKNSTQTIEHVGGTATGRK